ncbi:hypothetical protein V1264_013102 [Littorina saxatilis]|uniref:Reverse transcriptase n=1 Tax=Littorina saxatilis TaxID=31220 RepID=A0AAN9GJG0_9CAEN
MEHAPKMDWTTDNPAESFKLFSQRIELYFKAKKVPTAEQTTHILLQVGEEGLRRYNSWTLTDDDEQTPAAILKRFREQLEPSENFRVARLKLMAFRQGPSESLDNFANKCKLQAIKCDFSTEETNERIIELIIANTTDADYQKNLLSQKKGLKLENAVQIGRTFEATACHVQQLQDMRLPSTHVHSLQTSRCKNCGRSHEPRKCPAYGSQCRSCGKENHWAKVCRSSATGSNQKQQSQRNQNTRGDQGRGAHHDSRRAVHDVQASTDVEDHFDMLSFNNVKISSITRRDEAFVQLNVKLTSRPGIHNLNLKVDTGAQGNTLPLRTFRQMFPDHLREDEMPTSEIADKAKSVRLTAYNGTTIPCHGIFSFPCKFRNSSWKEAQFHIVDVTGPAVMGLPTCEQLKVVTLHCSIDTERSEPISSTKDLMRRYPQQFDRIGDLPGEAKLVVDPDVPTHIDPPRKTPIALKDSIKNELDKMEESGVIKRVTDPTDWVSSLAYSHKKGGELRVCLDPRHLNKALKRPHHKTPTVEELTHKFQGAKVFSKLDAKSGYWSVQLHPDSQLLTTFQSPFGRYCFKRLPFGLSVSQDIFQLKMDQILEQVDGTVGIADDVAVYAKTNEEHDKIIHNLFKVAAENGLVFNSEKCTIKTDSITFFGMKYDTNGVHPDPEKVTDLHNMATPTNKKELQTFLGFIQFLAPFIPKLSEKSAVLRDLLKNDVPFIWESHHQASIEKIKEAISETSTLRYFDTSKTPTLQTDASIKGLGASLIQDQQPIAYASKSLSDAETRYACIERELMAVVFGVQRFHTYLFGRPFKVVTDHKPLVMILNKPLTSAPPRLQRMLLKLQGYNFVMEYQPGSTMALADTLSRLPSAKNLQEIDLDIRVSMVRFSSERTSRIRAATEDNATCRQLTSTIVTGWPDTLQEVPPAIRTFWHFRDELAIEDGLILKGQRLLIPESQREDIMEQLHYGHQGIEKTRLRARESVFWPGINKDIEQRTKSCPICQEHKPSQSPESLMPHEVPSRPWETLGTDLFRLHGYEYLLLTDYYSKYFIVRKLAGDATSNIVIRALKQMFSEHGIPSKLISDNGPQFSSDAFVTFAREWAFDHITSSPRYPRSNGMSERHVQTVKDALQKASQARTDPDLALLCLRTTPLSSSIPSPLEILTGRKARSNMPIKLNSLPNSIREELQDRQNVQKMYHDRHAKDLPVLQPGQQARVQDYQTGKWIPATVTGLRAEPRSYQLATQQGQMLRRNRVHIRDVPQAVEATPKPPQQEPLQQQLPSQAGATTTRSGRIVKAPQKLDL